MCKGRMQKMLKENHELMKEKDLLNNVHLEDCIVGMGRIPTNSVDMVLCDLPYGTTRNKWDSIINLDLFWKEVNRVAKNNAAIVLTAAQPFTSVLLTSNISNFKYSLVWDKTQITGFLNAKKQPLRRHEDILVFYRKQPTYNPQKTEGKPYSRGKGKNTSSYNTHSREVGKVETNERYPTSIINIPQVRVKDGHPTQKPVELFEYLIKTYSNPSDVILDCTIGSGTTALAAFKTRRNFIGFETERKYVEMAEERIGNFIESGDYFRTHLTEEVGDE